MLLRNGTQAERAGVETWHRRLTRQVNLQIQIIGAAGAPVSAGDRLRKELDPMALR